MPKTRVYELARELGVQSKEMLARLEKMGIQVVSHQSTLTELQIEQIRNAFLGKDVPAKSAAPPKVIRRRRRAEPEQSVAPVQDSPGDNQSVTDEAKTQESVQIKRAVQKVDEIEETEPKPKPESVTQHSDLSELDGKSVSEESGVGQVSQGASSDPASQDSESSSGGVRVESTEVKVEAEPRSEVVEATGVASVAGEDEDSRKGDKLSGTEAAATEEPTGKSPLKSSGATIVRRATPEEVANSRRALQQRSSEGRRSHGGQNRRPHGGDDGKSPVFNKRSDRNNDGRPSRPQKEPGLSSRQVESSPIDPSVFETKQNYRSSRAGPVKKTGADERDIGKPKVAVTKNKRDQVSTRSLLAAVDSQEDETPDTSTSSTSRKRTVYTPPTLQAKKRDLKRRKDLKKTQITTPRASYRIVKMTDTITVAEFAKQLGIKGAEIIKKLMTQGVMVSLNQEIDFDTATLIATEYQYEVHNISVSEENFIERIMPAKENMDEVGRPPIVTIMGHVDHGKTSILDAIREERVTATEAGGITQHIGAYSVETASGKRVTFLDTPGHEAFSAMRQRGARLTDIVVLVVAADDGVMPQTVEAISHAKEAGVPVIVAVNKIDKPNINLDRVYTELMERGVQSEEWGGETQFVKVSAIEKTGLDELLEAISLQAEILELKGRPEGPAEGAVVEAHLDKGRGPVATVMVQAGALAIGDVIVAGEVVGRVRAMQLDSGERVSSAGPSIPVEIVGLDSVPMAGDSVHAVGDEKTARELSAMRREQMERRAPSSSAATLESLLGRVSSEEVPEVPFIIKADTQGSVEAIAEALIKLNVEKVTNRIVHKGVGGVSESDLRLANTSGSVVIAFNVRMSRGVGEESQRLGVPVKYFSVIYEVVDAVKAIMAGTLPPVLTEVIQGRGEVRQTIKVPKIGMVAGTAVLDGKITRNSQMRLIRDDVVIFKGKIGSLRRFKDDVKEVSSGYECGVGIDGYTDVREGDLIESFVIQEERPTL